MKSKEIEKPKPTKIKTEPSKAQIHEKEARRIEREIIGDLPDTNPIPDIKSFDLTNQEIELVEGEVELYKKLKAEETEIKRKLDVLRKRLIAVTIAGQKTGFRCETGVVTVREQTNQRLSSDKLLKHIKADVLESCKEESEPFFVVTVKGK